MFLFYLFSWISWFWSTLILIYFLFSDKRYGKLLRILTADLLRTEYSFLNQTLVRFKLSSAIRFIGIYFFKSSILLLDFFFFFFPCLWGFFFFFYIYIYIYIHKCSVRLFCKVFIQLSVITNYTNACIFLKYLVLI